MGGRSVYTERRDRRTRRRSRCRSDITQPGLLRRRRRLIIVVCVAEVAGYRRAAEFPVGRWSCYVTRAARPRLPCNCFTGNVASAGRHCLIYGSVPVRATRSGVPRVGQVELTVGSNGAIGLGPAWIDFRSVCRMGRGMQLIEMTRIRTHFNGTSSHFINIWRVRLGASYNSADLQTCFISLHSPSCCCCCCCTVSQSSTKSLDGYRSTLGVTSFGFGPTLISVVKCGGTHTELF